MLKHRAMRGISLWVNPLRFVPSRGIQVGVSLVKRGQVVSVRDRLWVIMDSSHHRQARGGAHYKIELKELLTGSKAFERYNSGTLIEAVTLEQKVFQFLYADDRLHLIDPVTFEEHDFSFNIVAAGDKVLPFLQDPMEIKVEYHEDKPVIIKVPDRATYTVVETSPSSHSSSESGKGTVFKPAILDNGSTVNVPEFVAMGDQVVVDLSDQSYHSRVRESSS